MTHYIALIRKTPASDYGVDFPDFPGCITAGRTLDEARQMASEALPFHIEGMRADRHPVPAPSTLEQVMKSRRNTHAVAVLIEVEAPAPRAVRVNVMLPEDLVQAIDAATPNRSRFLAEAARAKLREPA